MNASKGIRPIFAPDASNFHCLTGFPGTVDQKDLRADRYPPGTFTVHIPWLATCVPSNLQVEGVKNVQNPIKQLLSGPPFAKFNNQKHNFGF